MDSGSSSQPADQGAASAVPSSHAQRSKRSRRWLVAAACALLAWASCIATGCSRRRPPRVTSPCARQMLYDLGLDKRERNSTGQLSAGQQQRVAIARVLINETGLPQAGEPTGNLDTRASHEIMQTHEADIADLTDHVITMRVGNRLRTWTRTCWLSCYRHHEHPAGVSHPTDTGDRPAPGTCACCCSFWSKPCFSASPETAPASPASRFRN